MALTRVQAETKLIQRLGNLLTAAGLDGTTKDGTNESLNDPIEVGLSVCGYPVADISLVSDDDCAAVALADYTKFFDLAELRALENVLGNYDAVDLSVGPRRESFSQLREGLLKRLESKRMDVLVTYGIGLPDAVVTSDPFYGATADVDNLI